MTETKKKVEHEKAAHEQQTEARIGKGNALSGAISSVPLAFIRDWLFAYFFPSDAYRQNSGKATLMGAAKTFALSGLIGGIAYGLYVMLIFVLATLFLGSMNGGLFGSLVGGAIGLVAAAIIAFIVVFMYPIATLVFGFIFSGAYFVLAKVVGGRGTFTAQTFGLANFQAGMLVVTIPLVIFSAIPCAGIAFSLLMLVAGAYGLYGLFAIIRESHGLSSARAATVALVPPFLLFAFLAVIYVFMLVLPIIAGK